MTSRFRWLVLGLATVMQLGVSLPQQTPAALGPILTASLHLSRAELGLLTDAIWGGMLIGMLPFGMLADRYGERGVIALAGMVQAVFFCIASFTTAFLSLFLLFIPAAIAASAGSPGGARALAGWFPPTQRGMAMGVRQTGVTAAGVLAAITLPPIALAWGWPVALRAVAAVIVVVVALFSLFYREPAGERTGPATRLRLRNLAANRGFLAATAFGWIFMGALGCSVTYVAIALHENAGLTVVDAGLMLAVLQVGGVAGRVGWGIWSDRLGSRALTMAQAGALAVLAALAMAWLGHGHTPVVVLGGVAFALGLTTMGWNALYITLASELAPEHPATAVGAGTTVTFTGMLLATPIFGAIADRSGSYTPAWIALAGWCALGTLVALLATRSSARTKPSLSRTMRSV